MTEPSPPPSRPQPMRGLLKSRHALLVPLLAGLLLLALITDDVHQAMLRIGEAIERVAAAHPVEAIVLVIGFAALSAMLAFVSTAVIAPFLATTWGPSLAALLLWSGWLLGGVLAYAVGRGLGRPVIRRLVRPGRLDQYEEFVSQHAPFGLVLLFQLALPSEIPGYLLGVVRYSFPKYLLSLALAELPYALATVYLGEGVMKRRLAVVAGVGAAVLLLSLWSSRLLSRRLHSGRN